MTVKQEEAERAQTSGEEIANWVSHGIGLAAAVAVSPLLIVTAWRRGDPEALVGAGVFVSTVALLYLASTLYHAWRPSRTKDVLRLLDHSAIYLLIAGTYTPFTLGVLRGTLGWILLTAVWTLALLGIAMKGWGGVGRPGLSTAFYLALGWLALLAAEPIWQRMESWGLFWLAAGGVAYSAGVIFYSSQRMRYAHFVWHLFVLTGTACHVVAVLHYSA